MMTQSRGPTPAGARLAGRFSTTSTTPAKSHIDDNRRLVKKLINSGTYPTLGKHLAAEMEAQETLERLNHHGAAAGHSRAHTPAAASPAPGAVGATVVGRSALRSPSAATTTAAAAAAGRTRAQPDPVGSQRTTSPSASNRHFRPISNPRPEEEVRQKLAAVRDEHELAPSEADFLEEVLLDALSMPRHRRSEPGSTSPAKYAYSPDFENGVIHRQRKELQLLVAELRERDRELNDMVTAHQRQMGGWETDRRRCVQLEEKVRKLESEINERQTQVKTLFQKLAEAEQGQEERSAQVAQYQERLTKLAAENASAKGVVEEVEEANEVMEERIKELSSTIGLMEAREQEILSELKNKEQEMMHVHQELGDVSGRWKAAEGNVRAAEQTVTGLRDQVAELNAYISQTKKECEGLRLEIGKLTQENAELVASKERVQRELQQATKDAELAAERERRKDELIQSQKLKQERSDAELAHLRHLYERMQHDLAHLQLESSGTVVDDRHSLPGAVPAGLPPRPRPVSRNGIGPTSAAGHGPGFPARAASAAPRVPNGDPAVDALTRQHLEEYRARYTPVVPSPPTLHRVSSLPDLSPRDFVQAALSASRQNKMARTGGHMVNGVGPSL